ncbi:winged helix-turn-helix domain-containing protein [Actinomycetota bacterium Odt1-20B]
MVVTKENVAVDGKRKLSPHDIAEELRGRMRAGDLRPGDRLPTQSRLADEFGVERGTVRQALRKLQDEGLLDHVSKGAPPRIAEQAPEAAPAGEEPQPSMVGLAPRLTAAFAEPHVSIDVVSYTAETLMLALGEPVRRIHDESIRPESIDVRILLPSSDIDLAFPVPVTGADDGRLHSRWLNQRNAQGQVLRHNLLALRSSHGIDVNVTFRALPFTTPVKLYLLNGREALLAYYTLSRQELAFEAGNETLELYDAGGLRSPLFSFEKATGSARDSMFVEESQNWFDALWETITLDLTLS